MPAREESPQQAQSSTPATAQAVGHGGGALSLGPHSVTATRLNVRNQPVRAEGNIVTVVPHGTSLVVTGAQQHGFYPVTFGSVSGFVYGSYLSRDNGAGHAAMQRISAAPEPVHPAHADPREIPEAEPAGFENWQHGDLVAIQTELHRIGVYSSAIDGRNGPGTQDALADAFGADSWKQMTGTEVLARLKAATPLKGDHSQHRVRYGELFKDGVLDMTVALGFTEQDTDNYKSELDEFRAAFIAMNFKENNALGEKILKGIGRSDVSHGIGSLFVKENAITYKPPAGVERPVHAVVRLMKSTDGTGKQVADAFRDAMLHGDAAYYGGHGRYGTGPDFDRNMSFEVKGKDGWRHIDDYEELEHELKASGDPWTMFTKGVAAGTIKVDLSNDGNVYMNSTDAHPNEFGSRLMHYVLKQGGKTTDTGASGSLATKDEKYKVWMFDGCRTVDYDRSIRATPGQSARNTSVLETNKETWLVSHAPHVVAFLSSILDQQSAEQLVRNVNKNMADGDQHSVQGSGFGSSTIVR